MTGKRSDRPTTDDVPSVDIRTANIQQGATGAYVTCQGRACTVSVNWTPLHFGSHRPWWECPVCHGRVAIIYFGTAVACRTCLDLAYQTNRTTKASKPFTRARNVRERLGWHTAIAAPFGDRPRYMHWTTMARLMRELAQHTRDVMTVAMASTKRIQCKLEKMGLD